MGYRRGAMETVARLKPRTLVLFGASGRLGGAIAAAAMRQGLRVEPVRWLEARDWLQLEARAILRRLAVAEDGVDLVFAGGMTDPSQPAADLMLANAQLPARTIEATADDPRFRYLTIGSVLETFAELAVGNPYFASKAELWRQVSGFAEERRLHGRIAHLRLHTLYGGLPAPHSFLGQIYASIKADRTFTMSAGRQLREYSHVDDVSRSLITLLEREWRMPMVFDLSTGKSIKLYDLATKIFNAFDRADLLQIGALGTPKGENMHLCFPPSPAWLLGEPRDSVEGILDWLAVQLGLPRGV